MTLAVYRILINLILLFSAIIILIRILKGKEDLNRFPEKLGFFSKKKVVCEVGLSAFPPSFFSSPTCWPRITSAWTRRRYLLYTASNRRSFFQSSSFGPGISTTRSPLPIGSSFPRVYSLGWFSRTGPRLRRG